MINQANSTYRSVDIVDRTKPFHVLLREDTEVADMRSVHKAIKSHRPWVFNERLRIIHELSKENDEERIHELLSELSGMDKALDAMRFLLNFSAPTVRSAIDLLLEEGPRSQADLREEVVDRFPWVARKSADLNRLVDVTLRSGLKKGRYTRVARGIYELAA